MSGLAGKYDRWRLNAPVGYHWDDGDVLHEKNMSFLNGLMAGVLLFAAIVTVLAVIF